MKKRILSAITAMVMLLGIQPVQAVAATEISIVEIVPLEYDAVGDFNEGLAAVCLNGAWGFIDKSGKEVVPCKYSVAEPFSEGLAAVVGDSGKRDEFGDPIYKWGFIDNVGNVIVPFLYDGIGYGFRINGTWQRGFSEGLVAVRVGDYDTGKWGFIDKTGKETVPCKYKAVECFSEGLASVQDESEKWGFIDQTGKEVISCQYDSVGYFSEGYACVGMDNGKGYTGFWWARKNFGFIDRTGRVVVPLKYEYHLSGFSEGLAGVDLTGGALPHWGYVNTVGEEVVSCKYIAACDFSGGIAAVCNQTDKWGIIDKSGKEIVPCTLEYLWVREFEDGLSAVYVGDSGLDGKWGAIDETGREIVPCKYDNPHDPHFSEGLMAVAVDTAKEEPFMERIKPYNWGFVNQEGQEVGALKYNWVRNFNEGLAAVNIGADRMGRGGKWGFVQKNSTELTAYASDQSVLVDGAPVNFRMYALKNKNGNFTNYVKLRDVAYTLNNTETQFQVSWDGAVNILSGQSYTPNGSEMTTPFSGNKTYASATAPTKVNGKEISIDAIVLTDNSGGAYTYYKLRDLGQALGFNVGWAADKGIFVETGKPYDSSN